MNDLREWNIKLVKYIRRQSNYLSNKEVDVNQFTAIGSLMYAVAIVIEGGIDQRDMRKVNYISPREKDENLLQDMEDALNKLYKENKIVDNIQIANATGYDDSRKEVYIIYH